MAKRTTAPKTIERVYPWCETKFEAALDHNGLLCRECKDELLDESKEFVVWTCSLTFAASIS